MAYAEIEALELVKNAIDEIKQEEPTHPSTEEESQRFNAIEDFDLILQEMLSTYKKKNADYGNSFAETIQEFGFIPAVARISDKVKRMKNIVKGQKMNYDESLRDALMDAACYCVMTVVKLDKKNIENK